jgi:cutinase
VIAAAVLLAAAGLIAPAALPAASTGLLPSASAASCPEAEVVFARGRTEPAGTGILGNAFVSALRSKVSKNVGVYAVRYPADNEVDIGANDMSQHISYMLNNCPYTRLVLGGYSLGAAVTDVVLAVPIAAFGFDNPMPAGADQHIAAVALFGNGAAWVGPITNFNPVYNDRTIELCHAADPICNPADPNTWKNNWPDHLANAYLSAGMVNQAADFVAGKL